MLRIDRLIAADDAAAVAFALRGDKVDPVSSST